MFTTDVEGYLRSVFGSHFNELQSALLCPPNITTLRVNLRQTDVHDAIKTLHQALEAVSNGIRYDPKPHPVLPDCVVIPCNSQPNALKFISPFVVVDAGCGEAVLRGSHVFAPGVLAASSKFSAGEELSIIVHVRPTALLKGALVPEDTRGDYLHVANGIAVMSRYDMLQENRGLAVRVTASLYNHPPLSGVQPETFFLQNLPSMCVAHLLNPQPRDRVLDMCAAPGGKATHMAALVGAESEVVALDRSAARLEEVGKLADLLGCAGVVRTHKMDANKAVATFGEATFDRVLLDPPCSGLGLRPRLRPQTASLADLEGFASYQRKLLRTAAQLLRPGGTLVYSTCTINPMENEGVVGWAVEELRGQLHLCPLQEGYRQLCNLGGPGLEGCGLPSALCGRVVRFDPALHEGATGFFVAAFTKEVAS